MLTWIRPARGSRSPIACTPGIPPLDSRTARAISCATASVGRVELEVVRDERIARRRRARRPSAGRSRAGRRAGEARRRACARRARAGLRAGRTPDADRPPSLAVQEDRARRARRRSARRPRAPPRRPLPRRAARAGRAARRRPRRRAGARRRARADRRARARARGAGDERVDEGVVVADEREDGAVVVRIGVDVEETRACCANASPIEATHGRVAPLGDVRHRLEHDPYPTSRDGRGGTREPTAGRARDVRPAAHLPLARTARRSSSRRCSRSPRRSPACS